MYYRCELLIGGMTYDATNELVNWDDVEMSFKRGDYDGVVRSFSTKFEFTNGAYSLLLKEYLSNYLNSSATLVFYTRNNSWLLNEKFRCALDYSTFSYNDTTCEINAVDNSLASLIKAKKGTQYEYPVKEIKESQPLDYDRLLMNSDIKWSIPSDAEEPNVSHVMTAYPNAYYTIPFYMLGQLEIATKDIVEVFDTAENRFESTESLFGEYLFKNISDRDLTIRIKVKFSVFITYQRPGVSFPIYIRLSSYNENSKELKIYYQSATIQTFNTYTVDIDENLTISPGEMINFNIALAKSDPIYQNFPVNFKFNSLDTPLNISFSERGKSVKIDCISPKVLLNRLLRSITDKNNVTGEIATGVDERLDMAMIVPAESIRGLPNAKIYTSYIKFANWMSAEFGFVPVIGDEKVTFVHRDTLFQDTEIKDLQDSTSDLEYNVNAGLVYSGVKVGYDKQDYDSVNGRDEFRFTNEYTTGITLTDNVLELVSPYRADAYGMEFLAEKRGEDTTDSDSDNDIFFVGASLDGEKYKLVRDGYTISGVISPSTMFNAMYSQRFMIEANARYIGAFANALEFTSSDGNSDVTINGVSERSSIVLGNKLFTVGELSVKTGDLEIPSDLTGYIRVEKNGHIYKGYVKSASYNYGRPEAVKYYLIVKSVD
ncbi:hypothetical protein [Bacteroides stercoris]|uniref:hypothetical protein n=1 Tax=Bacteroides stercoris TaxID=46506 RepID=UPI00189AED14|nr:hypothetical protein [Bacteroides stercoris]